MEFLSTLFIEEYKKGNTTLQRIILDISTLLLGINILLYQSNIDIGFSNTLLMKIGFFLTLIFDFIEPVPRWLVVIMFYFMVGIFQFQIAKPKTNFKVNETSSAIIKQNESFLVRNYITRIITLLNDFLVLFDAIGMLFLQITGADIIFPLGCYVTIFIFDLLFCIYIVWKCYVDEIFKHQLLVSTLFYDKNNHILHDHDIIIYQHSAHIIANNGNSQWRVYQISDPSKNYLLSEIASDVIFDRNY